MNNELPDPWGAELGERGIHSYRDLAAATGVGHETTRRLVLGGRTSVGTVNRVADKLFGGDRNKVWRMHGKALEDHGDWTLPDEASLLTDKQREAVKAVILAMAPSVADAAPAPAEDPRTTTGVGEVVVTSRKKLRRPTSDKKERGA